MNHVRIYGNDLYQKQVSVRFNSIALDEFFVYGNKVRLHKEFEEDGTKVIIHATFNYDNVNELLYHKFKLSYFLFQKRDLGTDFVAKIDMDMNGSDGCAIFKDSYFNVMIKVINFKPFERKKSKAKRKARENAQVFTREGK